MYRDELKIIQSETEYPSLSILMPTHQTYPENAQDLIRLKNLISDAKKRLLSEFKVNEVKQLLANLELLISEIDFNYSQRGLAMFVNNDNAHKLLFPFPVKERLLIDRSFAIRDIVFAMNRSELYWVLMITNKVTKLYSGNRESLSEIKNHSFPFSNPTIDPDEPQILNERLSFDDEKLKMYLRDVDNRLTKLNTEKNEIILTGVKRNIALFKSITKQEDQVVDDVGGSYDDYSPQQLADLAWPLIKNYRSIKRTNIINELENSKSENKYAAGIDECWKLANEGRCRILLVEIGYNYPARLEGNKIQLIPTEVKPGFEILDDAVDDLIDKVVTKNGEVVFFENGELEKYERIAMILRY